MRITVCDLCGGQYPIEQEMLTLIIPIRLSESGTRQNLDICSMNCLLGMNSQESPAPPEGMDYDQEEEGAPPMPTITRRQVQNETKSESHRPITPDESSRLTGVRMKY